jgi:Lrp/AsnC family transcriptional regulator, leucine-responsive regulatory protein
MGKRSNKLQGPRRVKIDRLDMKILATLADLSRQSTTEVARKVGLSARPCAKRLERLERGKSIVSYCADVNIEQLGDLNLYHVTIAGKSLTFELARRLEELILQNPFIVSADAVFGSLGYVLRVYARDAQHCRELVAPLVGHVIECETWPVSRRIVRSQTRRLIEALAREEN